MRRRSCNIENSCVDLSGQWLKDENRCHTCPIGKKRGIEKKPIKSQPVRRSFVSQTLTSSPLPSQQLRSKKYAKEVFSKNSCRGPLLLSGKMMGLLSRNKNKPMAASSWPPKNSCRRECLEALTWLCCVHACHHKRKCQEFLGAAVDRNVIAPVSSAQGRCTPRKRTADNRRL